MQLQQHLNCQVSKQATKKNFQRLLVCRCFRICENSSMISSYQDSSVHLKCIGIVQCRRDRQKIAKHLCLRDKFRWCAFLFHSRVRMSIFKLPKIFNTVNHCPRWRVLLKTNSDMLSSPVCILIHFKLEKKCSIRACKATLGRYWWIFFHQKVKF